MRSTWVLLVVVLVILALGCGCAKKPTALTNTPSKPGVAPANTTTQAAIKEDIDESFVAAMDKFMAKDTAGFEAELAKATDHLTAEAKEITGTPPPAFDTAKASIDKLVAGVKGGTIKDHAELTKVFAKVDYDLGIVHFDLAKKAKEAKDATKMGDELHAAAGQLVFAAKWGGKAEADTKTAQDVRDLAARVSQAGTDAGEDVEGAIKKLDGEFARLGKDLKLTGK